MWALWARGRSEQGGDPGKAASPESGGGGGVVATAQIAFLCCSQSLHCLSSACLVPDTVLGTRVPWMAQMPERGSGSYRDSNHSTGTKCSRGAQSALGAQSTGQ